MTEWKVVKLSDLGEIVGGATPSTSREDYYNGAIPWLTPKDLAGYLGRYISRGERNITQAGLDSCSAKIMPKHTVLFSSRAPIGYLAIAENDICTNQGFKSIIPNDNINYLFLYYLLMYNKNVIELLGSGTTFKEVSSATMKNIEVQIPVAIEIQEKIASILDSIDTKIENNRRINDILLQQMKLYYLSTVANGIFYSATVDDIVDFYDFMRKPLSSKQREDMEKIYPYYGATTIVDYVDNYLFEGLYILVSEDGANVVDKNGYPLLQYTYGRFWVNNHAHVVKGKNNVSDALAYTILGTTNIQSIVTGAAQPKVNQANLRKLRIELPSDEIINQLNLILSPMLDMMVVNDMENQYLSHMRNVLLPQLMSGELDVSNIII